MVRLVIPFFFLLALPVLAEKGKSQDGVTELFCVLPDSAICLEESLCRNIFGNDAVDRAIVASENDGQLVIHHHGDKMTVWFYEKYKKMFCIRTVGFALTGEKLNGQSYDPSSRKFIQFVPVPPN
jgi:hypothetical protein